MSIELLKKIDEALDVLDTNILESERDLIVQWEDLYNDFDESQKSHLIAVLIGKGIIKKENGKLTKGDSKKVKETFNSLGIKKYKRRRK